MMPRWNGSLMSDIPNAVCVDDDPQAVRGTCREEGIDFVLLSAGLRNGTIVVCRSGDDVERLLASYGDRAHLRVKGHRC